MHEQDMSTMLQQHLQAAYREQTPLCLSAGNTKNWYGEAPQGLPCSIAEHRGVMSYEPSELVLTARAGTPLAELESVLQENGQHLPFEPPHFGTQATLGGCIATNFSGPARPYYGAARDFVLGCQILNGEGKLMRFGGQVMKNVAGYDVARLMCGAMGTLGLILDVSLKVLPAPAEQITLVHTQSLTDTLAQWQALALQPLPISAACWWSGHSYLRLSGSPGALQQAQARLTGDRLEAHAASAFWQALREQELAFFKQEANLWRLSVPAATAPLDLAGDCLYDWGGAQRWLMSMADADTIRKTVNAVGGHASLFRAAQPKDQLNHSVFQPLTPALRHYQRQLKQAFDPKGLLNPQRLYRNF